MATSTTPVITAAELRKDFPEFCDEKRFPSSTILYWTAVATILLNPSRWGELLVMGTELFVAHNLHLEVKAKETADQGGWPGISKGAISSEGPGEVHVSYEVAPTLEEDAGHWNLTEYGTRFIHTARLLGAGPMQIGAGFFGGPGFVPYVGQDNKAWPGPNCKPGVFS